MTSSYGWPVSHREGWPDLVGEEIPFASAVQTYNARARNIKVLFINQHGFEALSCGQCQMNWDTVIENYLCPSLKNTLTYVN